MCHHTLRSFILVHYSLPALHKVLNLLHITCGDGVIQLQLDALLTHLDQSYELNNQHFIPIYLNVFMRICLLLLIPLLLMLLYYLYNHYYYTTIMYLIQNSIIFNKGPSKLRVVQVHRRDTLAHGHVCSRGRRRIGPRGGFSLSLSQTILLLLLAPFIRSLLRLL